MRWPAFLLLMVLLASALHGQESRADAQSKAVNQPAIPAKQEQFFARQIRPVLVEHGIELKVTERQTHLAFELRRIQCLVTICTPPCCVCSVLTTHA
tara:strand:- start:389 stop:679 length:291 start_codon:yes stop_codon:yes gene_type:complete